MEWFQIERNHYSHDYLILLAKNILPLQRQTSKPPRSWRCKSLVGHKKKTDGNFLDWVNEYDTYSGNNSSLEGLIEKDEITSDEE